MKRNIKVSAILTHIATTNDGALRVHFVTREMSPDDCKTIHSYHRREGWLLFSEDVFQEKDIPEDPSKGKRKASHSQELRWLIMKRFQLVGGDWNDFYEKEMELIKEYEAKKLSRELRVRR